MKPEIVDPPPVAADPHGRDGYRAELGIVDSKYTLTLALRVGGEVREHVAIAESVATPGVTIPRLFPVARLLCRFLNSDTSGTGRTKLAVLLAALDSLPAWRREGLGYLGANADMSDVLYEITASPGDYLRVAEDQFAEAFDERQAADWYAQP